MTYTDNGYSHIAPEYYDPSAHPTCHNFSRLSRRIITEALNQCKRDEKILELGAGSSSAAAALSAYGLDLYNLEITDFSEPMLAHSNRWIPFGASLSVADATDLRHSSESIDWVVAGLADPYNTMKFWESIARVLRSGARAVVTLPSFEWATRFRTESAPEHFQSASFLLRDGSSISVPSYLYSFSDQCRMIEASGLYIKQYYSLGLDDLRSEVVSKKLNVFGKSFSSVVCGFVLIKT